MSNEKKPMAFTFGEPEAIRTQYDFIVDGIWAFGDKWYEPPASPEALSALYRAAVHHGSALQVKRNVLIKTYKESSFLSAKDLSASALDFLIFGNMFFLKIYNRGGKLIKLERLPAKYTRVGVCGKKFWWIDKILTPIDYKAKDVVHILNPDIDQEVYGLPDYLAATQSILLNENATVFRRRYYENGSHAGFILYMTDPAHEQEDINDLREALKESKGPGNFRNLFVYAPNGKKDGMQLIPISEVAANDEFADIKNISRDDQLAAHRVPPQLMGIIPERGSGFGDVAKAAKVFVANELEPLQKTIAQINTETGVKAVDFEDYGLLDDD